MKLKQFLSLGLALACTASLLAGCGGSTAVSGSADSTAASSTAATDSEATAAEHEPITIMDANRDYTDLIALVQEKYPEIRVQIEPYRGFNTSAYMRQQLVTDCMPDIYCTTTFNEEESQKKNLVDLSKYAISEMYNPVRLAEYDIDGGTYLLPYDYTVFGIGYNKDLFERNNIAVPQSFAQLRDETIPALKAAGIDISACLTYLPGGAFQYFFNIANTMYMNTIEGRAWKKAFSDMDSDVYAAGNEQLQACLDYYQQWIDCGMLNLDFEKMDNAALMDEYTQGNTAFFVGDIRRYAQNSDGSGDQYGLLPYLSEDGTRNAYVVQNTRMYGLNKHLEDPGNEQKLEDALHFLEVMSTAEGYNAIFGETADALCSIKDFTLPETSVYAEPVKAVNSGMAAPLVYGGWEDMAVPIGTTLREMIRGDATSEDVLNAMDEAKKEIQAEGSAPVYCNVTEELDTRQAAQLTGQIWLDATDADAAMVTYNVYMDGVPAFMENSYGANGRILPGPMTEQDIVIWLASGWNMNITTVNLTGSEIKKIVANGLDIYGEGYRYPYLLMTRDGKPLEDDVTYKLAFSGLNDEEYESYPVEETDTLGLDAAKTYLQKLGELSSASLDDSLLQQIDTAN